jgi:hypothetical protein
MIIFPVVCLLGFGSLIIVLRGVEGLKGWRVRERFYRLEAKRDIFEFAVVTFIS